jgi:glycosyltransferase involved in cell wall biosynthesis
MAAALPVVATSVGGIPDAMEDRMGGFLLEPQSVDSLVESLRTLLSSRDLQQKMGMWNYHRYEERYTLECFQRRWKDFLQQLDRKGC